MGLFSIFLYKSRGLLARRVKLRKKSAGREVAEGIAKLTLCLHILFLHPAGAGSLVDTEWAP